MAQDKGKKKLPESGGHFVAGFTSHNKRFSEMAVGVETIILLLPSTFVIVQVMAHPVRHFAKLPGVMRHIPYCGGLLEELFQIFSMKIMNGNYPKLHE